VLLGVLGVGLLKVLRLDGDNRAWAGLLFIMKLFWGKSVVVTERKGVRRREK
jgi:hypothetical protein